MSARKAKQPLVWERYETRSSSGYHHTRLVVTAVSELTPIADQIERTRESTPYWYANAESALANRAELEHARACGATHVAQYSYSGNPRVELTWQHYRTERQPRSFASDEQPWTPGQREQYCALQVDLPSDVHQLAASYALWERLQRAMRKLDGYEHPYDEPGLALAALQALKAREVRRIESRTPYDRLVYAVPRVVADYYPVTDAGLVTMATDSDISRAAAEWTKRR